MPTTFCGFTVAEVHPGTRLFHLSTGRHKSAVFLAAFRRPLDGRTAAAALVPALLRRGTESLPSRHLMARRLEELYGASVSTGVQKHGDTQVVLASLDTVGERFLPGGADTLGPGLAFLEELLLRPKLEEGRFPQEAVAVERENALRLVRGIYDDKASYARVRAMEEMCGDEPAARIEHGREEEIRAVGEEELREVYAEVLRRRPMEVYVVGAMAPERIQEQVERFAAFRAGAAVEEPPPPLRREARAKLARVEETVPAQQSRMVLGFRVPQPGCERKRVAQGVFTNLLGGGPHSRLFREVREKRSLAYAVHSGLDRVKGILLVEAGLDAAGFEAAVEVALEQVASLARGEAGPEELAASRELLRGALDLVEETPGRRIAWCMENLALDRDRLPGQVAGELEAIGPAEVAEAAAGAKPDLLFHLRPSEGAA